MQGDRQNKVGAPEIGMIRAPAIPDAPARPDLGSVISRPANIFYENAGILSI